MPKGKAARPELDKRGHNPFAKAYGERDAANERAEKAETALLGLLTDIEAACDRARERLKLPTEAPCSSPAVS